MLFILNIIQYKINSYTTIIIIQLFFVYHGLLFKTNNASLKRANTNKTDQ